MAQINRWRGDAQGKSQIDKYQITDAEVGDTITFTINRKDLVYTILQADMDDNPTLTASQVAMLLLESGWAGIAVLEPEFAEITASIEYDTDGTTPLYLVLTGDGDGNVIGKPFTVTTSTGFIVGVVVTVVQEGRAGQNEKQYVDIGTVTGGDFTLTFDGQTTSAIAYNASAATVDAALEALSNIGAGDVSVSGSAGGPWTVEFTGVFTETNVAQMTGNGTNLTKTGYSVTIATIQEAAAGLNEIQRVTIPVAASGGTFTLSLGGQTTAALAYNISAAALKTALDGLSTIDSVTVTKPAAAQWTVEFGGADAYTDMPTLIGDGTSLTGAASLSIATTTNGSGTLNLIYSDARTGLVTVYVRRSNQTGFSTWSFQYNNTDSAATIQSQVDIYISSYGSQSSVAAGDIVVTKSADLLTTYFELTGNWAGIGTASTPYIRLSPTVNGANLTVFQEANGSPVSEVQTVAIQGAPTGGTFTLTFEGQTTSALAYNASAATVETALEALSNLAPSEVAVTLSGWTYTVTISLSRDVAQMTGSAASLTGGAVTVTTTQNPLDPVNEKQTATIEGGPYGGTFTLTWNAETTGNIAYNATAATVQTSLEGLATPVPGDFIVSGIAGGPYTVEFTGTYEGTNVAAMTGSGALLSGSAVTVSTVQTAVTPLNEKQSVDFDAIANGGTFTLSYSGQTTSAIAYNASIATIDAALEALSNIGAGDVTVTGGPLPIAAVTVEFTTALAATNVAAMTGDGALLTSSGDSDITKTVDQVPTGPNWWSEAENWSLNVVPVTNDIVVFENSEVSVLYGLDASAISPTSLLFMGSFTGEVGLKEYTGTYLEYRPRYLQVGNDLVGASATMTVEIGRGEGSGSGLIRLNIGTKQAVIEGYRTGSSTDGSNMAVNVIGTHPLSVMRVRAGTYGVAQYYGEVAHFATIWESWVASLESDATVLIGAGATVGDVLKEGGVLVSYAGMDSIDNRGGDAKLDGAGETGTLTISGGNVFCETTGIVGVYGTISAVTAASPAVVSVNKNAMALVLQEDNSGATYVDETTDANDAGAGDWSFFPAAAGADDACYFALAKRFSKLSITIATAGAGTYTVTWEYWDGSAWAALSGVSDGTSAFKAAPGAVDVTWTMPTDWGKKVVNSSDNLYFVRARRNGGTVTTDPVGTIGYAYIPHGLDDGDRVRLSALGGMIELNQREFTIEVVTDFSFQLIGENSSAHTAYTSGGYWSKLGSVAVRGESTLSFSRQLVERQVAPPIEVYGDGSAVLNENARVTTLSYETGEFAMQFTNTTRFANFGIFTGRIVVKAD